MKMEQTQCFKTLAFKLQTLVNHPEESIQHLEHGESLKSRSTVILETLQQLHKNNQVTSAMNKKHPLSTDDLQQVQALKVLMHPGLIYRSSVPLHGY
jgi:hypothetical protein